MSPATISPPRCAITHLRRREEINGPFSAKPQKEKYSVNYENFHPGNGSVNAKVGDQLVQIRDSLSHEKVASPNWERSPAGKNEITTVVESVNSRKEISPLCFGKSPMKDKVADAKVERSPMTSED